jgi:hypothetical protein
MPTLNRFPLLGLWAEEAARRLGYSKGEAEALGHAYAVLYAIRAQRGAKPPAERAKKEAAPGVEKRPRGPRLAFGGDDIEVTYDEAGKVRGHVGGGAQTPASYRSSVAAKFPPGYYEKLQACFRDLFRTYPPQALQTRLVYKLYDEWKKGCGVGRLVDLDELLRWCRSKTQEAPARRRGVRAG